MKENMKRFCLLSLLALLSISLHAENIRGPVSGTLSLDGKTEIYTGIEQICGIILEDVSPLIQGIKLTISADEDMAIYRNSFALYLYNNLDSEFTEDNNSYRGSQAFMRFIPFSDPISVLIPLADNHTLSPDRSSFLLADRDNSDDFPMILSILPITKGIPDSVYDKKISVKISPVFFNKGALNLNIRNDRGEEIREGIRISIDNKSYDWSDDPYILGTGLHNLIIRTEDGSEESISFTLEAGQTLIMDHILQYQLPLLSVETMEGLSVYLDEGLLSPSELKEAIEIQPGSHSIRFEFGDFQISRDFTAEMQQRISITMIPEILLDYR